jgi:hypothetical protein
MEFKVKKSIADGAAGPTAELKIYNMSLRTYFNAVKINCGLAIAVGYEDEMNGAMRTSSDVEPLHKVTKAQGVPLQLFLGNIRYCRRYRDKADWIVEVEAEASMWEIGSIPLSLSYQPGIDVYSMLQNLSTSNRIPMPHLQTVLQHNKIYSQGFSYFGNLRNFVFALCDAIDFTALIDAGEIKLIPPGGAFTSGLSYASAGGMTNPTTKGIFLSKETGLLQAPEPEQNSIAASGASAVGDDAQSFPESRWNIESLLIPQVSPGDAMLVQSKIFGTDSSGKAKSVFMMVIEIEYDGDNWKGEHKMLAKCVPVDELGKPTTIETPLIQSIPAQPAED